MDAIVARLVFIFQRNKFSNYVITGQAALPFMYATVFQKETSCLFFAKKHCDSYKIISHSDKIICKINDILLSPKYI